MSGTRRGSAGARSSVGPRPWRLEDPLEERFEGPLHAPGPRQKVLVRCEYPWMFVRGDGSDHARDRTGVE